MLAVSWCSTPVDRERLPDRLLEAAGERHRRGLVDLLAHDHELVTAEPRHGVGRPHRRRAGARRARPAPRRRPRGRSASLTSLKSSRSTNSTPVTASSSRADRASACSSRSRSSVRLASPVSGSCSASWRIRSSVAQPRERGRERVRDRAQEAHLVVAQLALEPHHQLVLGADGQPQRRSRSTARPPPARRRRRAGPRPRRPAASRASARRPRRRGRPGRRPRAPARPSRRQRAGASRPRAARRRRGRSPAAAGRRPSRRCPSSSRRRTPCRRAAGPTPRTRSAADARSRSTGPCCACSARAPARARASHVLADQLLALEAEQLLGERVDEHDPPVTRGRHHRVRQPFEHGAQRSRVELRLDAFSSSSGYDGAEAHVKAARRYPPAKSATWTRSHSWLTIHSPRPPPTPVRRAARGRPAGRRSARRR